MGNNVASSFINDRITTPPKLTEMTISTADYKVGATAQTYKFVVNSLSAMPMGARLDLVYPISGWKLDCANTASWPVVKCISNCKC